jgi:hypothetical protein
MEQRKKTPAVRQVRRQKNLIHKGVDTKKFCGVLKLKEDALAVQKKLRDEWH